MRNIVSPVFFLIARISFFDALRSRLILESKSGGLIALKGQL